MKAATEGNLPPVMPQGNLVEVLGREVRQGSPGELMVKSSYFRQRRPPCKTNREMSDEAADAAALTYLLHVDVWLALLRLGRPGRCLAASWVRGWLWGALLVSWRPAERVGGRVRGAEWVSECRGHARHGNG